ncbi:protein O-GlcNAcase-like isoform X1 [Branchiostoma floridae x Branchiostoma japonicum]
MPPMANVNGNVVCSNRFLRGVVEGFYGKPWTTDQRRELFRRMNKMGLNTYLYAPKDDYKHRAYWRDLYSVEEAEHLTSLIAEASESSVTFVYALSPGLDITFSSAKDVTFLKRKLEQVSHFGCKAFALLFDDIETDMCIADKEVFQSFAHAQVSVTNEVYQHLGQPTFLFCPTEYCESRAVPDIETSQYLTTVGSKLLPDIDVLWTGPRVVSKIISVEHIQKVTKTIKRPPVIWDNIHANDYDHKRVFLGPYDGRSTALMPHLHGVLTNPNCEFESNFMALHTLATWSKSTVDVTKKEAEGGDNSAVTSDIKLETEGVTEDSTTKSEGGLYNRNAALKLALKDWLEVIKTPKSGGMGVIKRSGNVSVITDSVTTVNTCMTMTPTTTSSCTQPVMCPVNTLTGEPIDIPKLPSSPSTDSAFDSTSASSESKDSEEGEGLEPMDISSSPAVSSPPTSSLLSSESTSCKQVGGDVGKKVEDTQPSTSTAIEGKVPETETMQVDYEGVDMSPPNPLEMQTDTEEIKSRINPLYTAQPVTYDDLAMLVDLFFLPFEHGPFGVHLIEEFIWLKTNSRIVSKCKRTLRSTAEDVKEWHERSEKYDKSCQSVLDMVNRLLNAPNRAAVYELFPYIYELKGIVALLKSFVKWLAGGRDVTSNFTHMIRWGGCTWSNRGYKDAFLTGKEEPWVFRGGLTGELQRLLPIDGAGDLFQQRVPDSPQSSIYIIRPYLHPDQDDVYEVCRKTCDDGLDGTDVFPDHPALIGDKLVGSFLNLSPEFCFVALDASEKVCGYVVAALDAKDFYKKFEVAWLTDLCNKYPKPTAEGNLSPAEEIINSFHNYKVYLPPNLYKRFPSLLRMSLLPQFLMDDPGVAKNMMACLFAALKANGSSGVYCEVNIGDKRMLEFYTKMGFFDVPMLDEYSEEVLILGRSF